MNIIIDDVNAGSFPFGSFFPTGFFSPALLIGGVDPSLSEIVQPGIITEGFKGCIDQFHVLGRTIDYFESTETRNLNFDLCKAGAEEENVDVYSFDGSGFAEYGVYIVMLLFACAYEDYTVCYSIP